MRKMKCRLDLYERFASTAQLMNIRNNTIVNIVFKNLLLIRTIFWFIDGHTKLINIYILFGTKHKRIIYTLFTIL